MTAAGRHVLRLDAAAGTLTALATALWPGTGAGPLWLDAGVGGFVELTASCGTVPLGRLAARLLDGARPAAPVPPLAAVGRLDAPGLAGYPIVLEPGSRLGVRADWAAPRQAGLLADRIAHAARLADIEPARLVEAVPPGPAEAALLRSWRGPQAPPVPVGGVHGLVAGHAARTPDRVALRRGPAEMTYGELVTAAAALAGRLRERGLAPGRIAVLRLPRGFDAVVAMLAVLQCGAGYSAVDPAWPAERVAGVLADTGAALLVGTEPDGYRGEAPVLRYPSPGGSGGDPAGVPVGPDDPFCVYFTSGSTGRPKGVLSTHRATLRTVLDPAHPRLGPDTVTLSAAPLPWDAFTLELWAPLVHGGRCVLLDTGHPSPSAVRRAVAGGVNTLWLTASLFNLIVDEDPDAFDGVGQVLTGGERLSAGHVRRFRDRYPGVRLVNGYGPVEATVFATSHEVTGADLAEPDGIPIGRPLPGTEVLILRETASGAVVRAVVGEPGEIAVAGAGLARGYLGPAAPENATRFPTVRLAGEPPLRLYRTGDLGRWRDDGTLLFLGRRDRQVKLRGHRVEPAGIERSILDTGLVRRCAVVPVPDGTGRVAELAAYVVPAGAAFDPAGLVSRLAATLPGYLVPAHVLAVPELPLGPTGKLDASALPPPTVGSRVPVGSPRPGAGTADGPAPLGTPPRPSILDGRTPVVAAEAAAVLGMSTVDDDADLLGLGLDSLGATRLATRLSRALDVDVSVAGVLDGRTPAAIAATLPSCRTAPPTAADGAPALGDGQVRFWLDDQLRTGSAKANLVLLGYEFAGPVRPERLAGALSTTVARHDALRTGIGAGPDGEPVAIPLTGAEALDVRVTDGPADVDAAASRLADRIDLGSGPLIAAEIVAVPHGLLLVLAIHHAAIDGDSLALLATELSAGLGGPPAPPAPRPYAAHARGRAALLGTPGNAQLTRDWAERLRDTSDLEWAKPGPGTGGYAEIPLRLPADLVTDLYALARRRRTTAYPVVLAACAGALGAVTDTPRFCLGSPASERGPRFADTIGLFVTTSVLPVSGDPGLPAARALDQATEAAAGAMRHREVALGPLLRALRRRATGRSPLFQAQLAWQNHPAARWRIPGVAVRELRIHPLAPQLELTVELWPRAADQPMDAVVEYDAAAVDRGLAQTVAEQFPVQLRRLCRET